MIKRLAIAAAFLCLLAVGFYFFAAPTLTAGHQPDEDAAPIRERITEYTVMYKDSFYLVPEIPDVVSFAGERVPTENFDIYESLDRELLSNCYFHSQTIRFLKLAPRYFAIVEPVLKQEKIPDDMKYLMVAESGFDPKAVSPAGATGLWQFMKGTADEYGLEISSAVDERYHVLKATHAACKMLHKLYNRFGSWAMVAAAYNAGPAGMSHQVDAQKQNSYYDLLLNPETARYVFRIVAIKLIMENPEKYGFKVAPHHRYHELNTVTLTVDSTITDLVRFANTRNTNYKMLKMLNPWLRGSSLPNPKKKSYTLELPAADFRQRYELKENNE
ncbi:MAG: lytic transglycosylase domain-containing protein [Bacteroidales bacterium]|jgi:hypothetical protein|nr:lytic transglycosylase domain-containing protein [Bacteroidales bacterium]